MRGAGFALRIRPAASYDLRRDVDVHEAERAAVRAILEAVQAEGDAAVRRFTAQFDGWDGAELRVPPEQLARAWREADPAFRAALEAAAANIRAFHERQRRASWFEPTATGTVLGQLIRPLDRVGVYVPGGRAAYPSTVLMNVIPAQVAGVGEIAVVTPPGPDGGVHPGILVACHLLGVDEVYRVGGAQAVAALAYGTETIRPVDKIVGPGNVYVALAKREVFGRVGIDAVAGPSEIVVLADSTADARQVAADLLSQAEHDPLAAAVLVTTDCALAAAVQAEVERQLADLPRAAIAREALERNGAILLAASLDEAVETVNRLAPEHLELLVADPWALLGRIRHAGAVFLGSHSPEPVGDYFAGPNHVLPTNGTARFSSGLSVHDFVKVTNVIAYSRADLVAHAEPIVTLARAEGLEAHARAVLVRLEASAGRETGVAVTAPRAEPGDFRQKGDRDA